MSIAACGEYSGQREPVPPPPAIAAGEYASVDTEPLWIIDLPQGGRSHEAVVRRCTPGCTVFHLPVRTGLNGLSISVPVEDDGSPIDLALSVIDGAPRLSYFGENGALVEAEMTPADVLAPVGEAMPSREAPPQPLP